MDQKVQNINDLACPWVENPIFEKSKLQLSYTSLQLQKPFEEKQGFL